MNTTVLEYLAAFCLGMGGTSFMIVDQELGCFPRPASPNPITRWGCILPGPWSPHVITTADFSDPSGLPVDGAGPLAAVCVDAHG